MKPELSRNDLDALKMRGISETDFNAYHSVLKTGYPYISLSGSCVCGKEIKQFDESERRELRDIYKDATGIKVLKFVPANAASSRMFKDLFTALDSGEYGKKVDDFFNSLSDYAFAKELLKACGIDAKPNYSPEEKKRLLEGLLLEKGMDYGDLPKGIIKFHKYSDGHVRTAFEEHFHEGAMYAKSGNICHLHFTIPAGQVDLIKAHLQSLNHCLSKAYNTEFKVETSIQKSRTDTPAIYEDSGEWVRTDTRELLFRPAGHGALLENLNDLDADIIFVKNIDNVVPDRLKTPTVEYKQVLAGVLLKVQKSIFRFLKDIDADTLNTKECSEFVEKWLNCDVSQWTTSDIKALLNRPLRVCGMVKNEGEPGGGPFIVNDGEGKTSLQIVEGAQIDSENKSQGNIAKTATHFNPVDLVLAAKDYRGKKFDLLQFRNSSTGMVVSKNYQGRNIKALELPGLWNGSMHYWNTLFVEVPIETFNPVKTVFDLARDAHRG